MPPAPIVADEKPATQAIGTPGTALPSQVAVAPSTVGIGMPLTAFIVAMIAAESMSPAGGFAANARRAASHTTYVPTGVPFGAIFLAAYLSRIALNWM